MWDKNMTKIYSNSVIYYYSLSFWLAPTSRFLPVYKGKCKIHHLPRKNADEIFCLSPFDDLLKYV